MKLARLAIVLCMSTAATAPAPAAGPGIETVRWLAGCWSRTDAEAGSGEQWTAPGGATMLGVSRTVREGRTVEYEFVLIRPAADGTLVYHAHPSGQAGAEFRLASAADREVVFENPAHDFPQRIGYRLEADQVTLTAWIEGMHDGTSRRMLFPMRRVRCDAPAAPTDD